MKILSKIAIGETAKIKKVTAINDIRRRLFDLGLVPGTHIECVQQNYKGTLKAFLVRGAVIALREEDSMQITID